jgi:hypothetical protein
MIPLNPKQERCLEQVHLRLGGLIQSEEQVVASHLFFSIHVNLLINFRIHYFIYSINIEMNMSTLRTLVWISYINV